MTLKELLQKCNRVALMFTSCEIPVKMNGKNVELDLTVEGDCGNYYVNITRHKK